MKINRRYGNATLVRHSQALAWEREKFDQLLFCAASPGPAVTTTRFSG